MRFIRNLSNRFRGKEEGQSLVEYGLIIALIALVVIVALTAIGGNIGNLFNNISNHL
ncbi:Flp family type IVb pilin [Alicyclobacillus sp. SO9]|uniref:Flp family type IVb pilin n=1 Tax=Alicyclobacillus sp. SO9 TaxID=2665646 RepID=UPI0018E8F7B7|nr:Flp family type IVb pilin [Alicyclobacillus sp. SO9]QQE79448.1 Flp family type IVb pilin [Alicyclobacillus sp. SO9]